MLLPNHTILECTLPATHPKDLNALLQGYLIAFGDSEIIPMTRQPDAKLTPNTTIEHYTWIKSDHPDAEQIKLTPHATWSKIVTSHCGTEIPAHDIYNPRLIESKLAVIIRLKKNTSDHFQKLSGTYGIFSNLKNREDEKLPVTMIWLKRKPNRNN